MKPVFNHMQIQTQLIRHETVDNNSQRAKAWAVSSYDLRGTKPSLLMAIHNQSVQNKLASQSQYIFL